MFEWLLSKTFFFIRLIFHATYGIVNQNSRYTINFNHFQNILEKENGNSIIEIKLKLTP